MSLSDLSQGILREIVINKRESATPTLQIVQMRELPKKGATVRYRVALSDGVSYVSAICSTKMNQAISDKTIDNYHIIKVTNYSVNEPNGKKVFVILDFDPVSSAPSDVIGNPVSVDDASATKLPDASLPKVDKPSTTKREEAKPASRGTVAKPPPSKIGYLPINSLNTYITHSWTIKAKIVQKTQMKTWNNARGSGNLFSVTLKDSAGTEIRGTFFKEDADRWYNVIEVEKVYSVSGGKIKLADKKFSTVDNDYELTFDNTTRFEEIADVDEEISGLTYRFRKLNELDHLKENSMVDVVVVVKHNEPAQSISTKKGPMMRRRVQVVDDTKRMVELTMWGDEAEKFPDAALDQVITVKDARVSEFRGKQLSLSPNSIMKIAPTDAEAIALKQWYDNNDSEDWQSMTTGGEFTSRMLYLKAVNDENLGSRKDTSDNFTFFGILMDVPMSRQIYYLACPNPDCRGKKVESNDGEYICHTCNKQIKDPIERYSMGLRFADFTGGAFMSCFGDDAMGQLLIGYTAHEWAQETADMADEKQRKEKIHNKLFCDYKIRCSVRTDEYNNTERQKFTVRAVTPVNYAEAAKFFAAEIEQY